ncbi:MAG: hypothetical protein M5U28_00585 [Sandaracinaceae bacterium]|nr:hypothetical protein [Sandaracinaceae bacterium]
MDGHHHAAAADGEVSAVRVVALQIAEDEAAAVVVDRGGQAPGAAARHVDTDRELAVLRVDASILHVVHGHGGPRAEARLREQLPAGALGAELVDGRSPRQAEDRHHAVHLRVEGHASVVARRRAEREGASSAARARGWRIDDIVFVLQRPRA